jgi:hypothetical protein
VDTHAGSRAVRLGKRGAERSGDSEQKRHRTRGGGGERGETHGGGSSLAAGRLFLETRGVEGRANPVRSDVEEPE